MRQLEEWRYLFDESKSKLLAMAAWIIWHGSSPKLCRELVEFLHQDVERLGFVFRPIGSLVFPKERHQYLDNGSCEERDRFNVPP